MSVEEELGICGVGVGGTGVSNPEDVPVRPKSDERLACIALLPAKVLVVKSVATVFSCGVEFSELPCVR